MQQLPLFEGAHSDFGLVGDSPEIQRVLRFIHKLRNNRCPVLLLGETGTGKEVVAHALHEVSPGVTGAFVAVNTAALVPTLVESELFGHARGSFTGATESKIGLIQQAHGGTLFLDEIGDLALETQAKLLRALEEKKIRAVGSTRLIRVDVRVIAATNQDLATEVKNGRFRRDLFYRLNVISLRLRPLRDRRQDIPPLIDHFLERYVEHPLTLTQATFECLLGYEWPGNVRELENCIRRIAALASGMEANLEHLPTHIRNAADGCEWMSRQAVMPLAAIEELAIENAMKAAAGDRLQAAKLLGIGKTTLYRKLKEYERKARTHSASG